MSMENSSDSMNFALTFMCVWGVCVSGRSCHVGVPENFSFDLR
jgi:hypothetical protein